MHNIRKSLTQSNTGIASDSAPEAGTPPADQKKLDVVVQILKSPMAADMDSSGEICATEAFLLGLALSLDAFGAGISAAMAGYPAWLTASLIGGMAGLILYSGVRFGAVFSHWRWMERLGYAPGIILILLGLIKSL